MFKNAWYKSGWFIRFNLFVCLGEENNYPPPQKKKTQLINWNKHHPLQILVLKDRFDQDLPSASFLFKKKLKMLTEDVCIKTDN